MVMELKHLRNILLKELGMGVCSGEFDKSEFFMGSGGKLVDDDSR